MFVSSSNNCVHCLDNDPQSLSLRISLFANEEGWSGVGWSGGLFEGIACRSAMGRLVGISNGWKEQEERMGNNLSSQCALLCKCSSSMCISVHHNQFITRCQSHYLLVVYVIASSSHIKYLT
ncbi:unnamed protein product [Onchocerca flexuosa]|uniref:RNase H domain-containing protein n=1 Tax=Onchocerca flexuosa TaxID=387005 RepID=A0A183H4E8_9BILA|nr:unnamed protein product [Onchocerca flexuosa]